MCYLVVERFSVCRCLYYKHDVDMCAAYGQKGHSVQERIVLVGYDCESHSEGQSRESSSRGGYSDSGYGTARHGSHRQRTRPLALRRAKATLNSSTDSDAPSASNTGISDFKGGDKKSDRSTGNTLNRSGATLKEDDPTSWLIRS